MEEKLSTIYLRDGRNALQYIMSLSEKYRQIATEAIFECLRLGFPLNNMEITGKARELQRKRNGIGWNNNKTSTIMIPRIKKMSVLDDYILFVEFDDWYKVLYDVKDDTKTLPSFRALVDVYGLFKQAQLDTSRTCVYWNDKIDLASDSIYEYGKAA